MTGISAHRNNLTPVLGQVFLSVGTHTPTGCRDLMKCQPRIMQVSSFYYSRNILFFYATFICIRWEGRGQQRGSQPGRQNEFDGEGGQEEDEQDGFWRWSSLERGAVCRCCHLFTPSPLLPLLSGSLSFCFLSYLHSWKVHDRFSVSLTLLISPLSSLSLHYTFSPINPLRDRLSERM